MTGLALNFTAEHADSTFAATKAPTQSFFERVSSYLYGIERRRREAEIAALLAQNGGQLTDDLERQMSRQFGRIVE